MKIKQITENGITYELYLYSNGSKEFTLNGLLHRENGPATERPNGTNEWWLGDEDFTQEDHQKMVKEIKKFYEAYFIGDMFHGNFILLGKISVSLGKLFKVYDIKRKEIYEELVCDFVR